MPNDKLLKAKNAKNDEFYTQYSDIQREVNAYIEYNPNVFRDKTILLPCDDPEWSNFTRFFAQNFEKFGLKKLISTSYARHAKQSKYQFEDCHQLSLFETESPIYDAEKSNNQGRIFTLEKDVNNSGRIDIDDLQWDYLCGDGDFQSEEVKKLRHEADIIITNPPFTLYIEFVKWLFEEDKKFLIIGNKSSIAYVDIFPLIKNNKMWSGVTSWSGGLWFHTPGESSELANVASTWFTNIEHGRRHQPIPLMTMNDNIKYSKHKDIKGIGYLKYDNYDAIEVPHTDGIPSDYDGVMGVPVTFLEKYCPEQFIIVGLTSGRDEYEARPIKRYRNPKQVNLDGTVTNGSSVNTRATICYKEKPPKVYYLADESDGYLQKVYARILIKSIKSI